MKLKFLLLALALAFLSISFGVYIQYEAKSWMGSAPLGTLSYEYYMLGAIFLFVLDMVIIVLVFELLYKQW